MSSDRIDWIRQRLASHQPQAIDLTVAPQRAAVSIVLREAEDGCCEILFIRRSRVDGDPWSGHMALPGGRVDVGDASALEAARRETLEEVALDLARDAELLGQLDDLRASARGGVLPMAITPFVFRLRVPASLSLDTEEVEEALWVPIRRLLDPTCASTVPYELGGQRFNLPCFNVSERIIWGLTYQMMMRFFAVVGWDVPLVRAG